MGWRSYPCGSQGRKLEQDRLCRSGDQPNLVTVCLALKDGTENVTFGTRMHEERHPHGAADQDPGGLVSLYRGRGIPWNANPPNERGRRTLTSDPAACLVGLSVPTIS
jgi:hypothetical protein